MIRNKHISIVITVVLVVLIVFLSVVGSLFLTRFLGYDSYKRQDFIDESVLQAVFLTNDQIYFGHLKDINQDYLMLLDVFYVKVNSSGAGQLVKLGQIEPHGPQDKMIINKDQILFWENLKPDSPVAKTIQNLEQK